MAFLPLFGCSSTTWVDMPGSIKHFLHLRGKLKFCRLRSIDGAAAAGFILFNVYFNGSPYKKSLFAVGHNGYA